MAADDRYFGFLVSDVSRLLRTEFDRRVRTFGLTRSQWLVLTRVGRQPGATQSELADMIEVERATAGRLLDRLEDNGWIRREHDGRDRRVRRVFLTPEAERVQRSMRSIADGLIDDALADLDVADRRHLDGLLQVVKARLARLVTESGNGSRNGRGGS